MPCASRVRGRVPVTQDPEGDANHPVGSASNRDAEGTSGARHQASAEDLVFGNRNGDALRESKLLTRVLQPAAEEAGLGRVTWHQSHHIHSSLLNDLKVPVKIAQEQLGHASISTPLNIYTHVVDASHRKAIEDVERELFPSVPKSSDRDDADKSASATDSTS